MQPFKSWAVLINNTNTLIMKKIKYALIIIFIISFNAKAQDSNNYIEFNDSKNVVHGVYLGLNFNYGEIDGKSTYTAGAKIAYVANRKFEIGIAGSGIYSDQNENGPLDNNDIYGGYGGLHLEPIFFGSSTFSLSVPLLIGGGAVSYSNEDIYDFCEYGCYTNENWEPFFVFEPGLNLQYNISPYLQVEMGAKYRVSSNITLYPGSITNINGFSAGIGLKVGVFNLGKKK